MSTKNECEKEKIKTLNHDSDMPCLVYFKDNKNIERIGVAEHYVDSKFVMVRYNSYSRDMIIDKELKICDLLNKI